MTRKPPSLRRNIAYALTIPLGLVVGIAAAWLLFPMNFDVNTPESKPAPVPKVQTFEDKQEQMASLVDPSEYPGCVPTDDWSLDAYPGWFVVVMDETKQVGLLDSELAVNQSEKGRAWLILACFDDTYTWETQ